MSRFPQTSIQDHHIGIVTSGDWDVRVCASASNAPASHTHQLFQRFPPTINRNCIYAWLVGAWGRVQENGSQRDTPTAEGWLILKALLKTDISFLPCTCLCACFKAKSTIYDGFWVHVKLLLNFYSCWSNKGTFPFINTSHSCFSQ